MFLSALGFCARLGLTQTSPQEQSDPLQQDLQQIIQAIAANERQLQTYQWTESTTVTIKGNSTSPKLSICRYAADGTILKTPLTPATKAKEHGGPMMRAIAKHEKEKVQGEVEQIYALMQRYVPLDRASLEQAFNTGSVDFEHDVTGGNAIVLHNYTKPGDELKIAYDRSNKQVDRVSVRTYLDKPGDTMTIDVRFAILPDRTLYPALTSVDAPSEKVWISIADLEFVRAY
jgi:hypothetical protein